MLFLPRHLKSSVVLIFHDVISFIDHISDLLIKQQYEQLKLELAEIEQTAEIHKKAIGELKEEYQKIRKTLLAKNFSYGPSIDELEKEACNLFKCSEISGNCWFTKA